MFSTLMLAAAAATAAPQTSADQAIGRSQLISSLQSCQSMQDNAARLACYDKAAGALIAANTRGDVAVVDREQVRKVRRSLFGFALPSIPFFGKERDAADEPKELVGKVAGFRDIGNGFFRIALQEPESTWESTESSDIYGAKTGETVTISRGALGSYFVEVDGRSARVRRVR
ncbi:MAG TPA: hypothetical protein VFP57_09010 [Sphingomicrobium sp.]|jgi:hypothetical protein|nr:hypothetical protein [Sphingomicrobium sp.]